MKYLEVYSSAVIVGEGFSPSLFDQTKYAEILGKVDPSNQVLVPILLQQYYKETKFKILITPDRIDIGYGGNDFLPDSHNKILSELIKALKKFGNLQVNGFGINLNLVINMQSFGFNGTEYCKKKFLNIKDVEKKFEVDQDVFNTSKLIFFKNDIKYLIDIEPNFKSNGENLSLKMNAHQNCKDADSLEKGFKKYNNIKNYLKEIPKLLLEIDHDR